MAITLPFSFVNGTVADAVQVNANFSALTNAVGGGAGGSLVVGGGSPPTPAPRAGSLIASAVNVQPDAAPAEAIARLCLNCYPDASTALHYIANGPALVMNTRATGPSGPESRTAFAIADINSAGPGALCNTVGILNLVYGPIGGGTSNAYVVIGDGTHVPSTFQPPQDSLLAEEVFTSVISLGLTPGATPVLSSRIHMNCWHDSANVVHYLHDGIAYNFICRQDNGGITFDVSPAAGVANAVVDFNNGRMLTILPPNNITTDAVNMLVMVNRGGTVTQSNQVFVGPVNSGPGGNGRALWIAN